MILVDTSVLLDVVEDDPVWADWSLQQMQAARLQLTLAINPAIYAELSMAYAHIEELQRAVSVAGLEEVPIPRGGSVPGGEGLSEIPVAQGLEARRPAGLLHR